MNDWIPLPDFPGYSATIDGRVKGPRGTELRSFQRGDGGPSVNLYRDNEMTRRAISTIRRMVASA